MENKTQSWFEEYRKKYIPFVSTELGYSFSKGLPDYKCLAKTIGIEPEKVKDAYKEDGCGAILIRKNGAELYSGESELEDVLVCMIPEVNSEKVVDKIKTQLKHKIPLIAGHRNGNSQGKLDLTNMALPGGALQGGVFTEYSHILNSPLYGSFANMLTELYGGKEVREEDYVKFVESIFSDEPNWTSEITSREK